MKAPLCTLLTAALAFFAATPRAAADDISGDASQNYVIRWYSNAASYMTEEADGSLVVAAHDAAQRQFWQFVPTGTDNVYYIRNVATGRYIQSCNMTESSASLVKTGTTPMPYYAALCTTASAAVKGYYRLTSTDCANYTDTSAKPRGLNKDGASSNIITWYAAESNKGSFWQIEATDEAYELRPFTPSAAIGSPEALYSVLTPTGSALTQTAGSAPVIDGRTEADNQHWYFVGESNATGYLIVNAATGETVNTAGAATATRWSVLEADPTAGTYYFRPTATKDTEGTALTVGTDSLFTFRTAREAFARSAQIYDLPCGTLGSTYLTKASVTGDGVVTPMYYPTPKLVSKVITYPSASKPSTAYVLYTTSKATVVAGTRCSLSLTFNTTPSSAALLGVYADWDRDGVFETAQFTEKPGKGVTMEVSVPTTAREGKTRLRVRLTTNGLTDAEDEVTGEVADFMLNVVAAAPEAAVSVSVNDTLRGTAAVTADNGSEATVTATPLGNATFVCWREGSDVRSASATYTLTYDRPVALTAYFSPNTDTSATSIGTVTGRVESTVVDVTGSSHRISVVRPEGVTSVSVYTPDGRLVARADGPTVTSTAITPGTYIVRATLPTSATAARGIVIKQ